MESFADVVDDLRQLQTDAGNRPYRVFAIVVAWSGGEVGRGDPTVVSERELLPTPLVQLRGIKRHSTSAGKSDRGYTELTELSPSYTEEQLQLSFHVKQPLEKLEKFEFFYEIQQDRRDSPDSPRRRFVLRDVPVYDVKNHQWVIHLSSQDKNRGKRGAVSKPERVWRR